ncbi:EexN family lipoprotein (plasmid) [Edwardsiella tarda]|uniref:EexN family lipoprotein n=1 Tax=Edwardsiella tarda TaxID=636 RepID=UPI000D5197A3|nr:EexN family lipoprotein [Edwardsiella tarda]UCQ29611.1 EexN family lipoprotein [Edwardsiella tarda]
MKNIILLILVGSVLAGCNEKVYDVSYYSEHLSEASKVIEQCKAGSVTGDNCKNADEALKKKASKDVMNRLFQ